MGCVTHHASLTFGTHWDLRMGISTATVTITTATASIHMLIVRWSDITYTNTQAERRYPARFGAPGARRPIRQRKMISVFYIAFFLSRTRFCLKGQKKLFSWLCLFVVCQGGRLYHNHYTENTAQVWLKATSDLGCVFCVISLCVVLMMSGVCNRCVRVI